MEKAIQPVFLKGTKTGKEIIRRTQTPAHSYRSSYKYNKKDDKEKR
jgi:hypothetical protein